jgi:hypothetical protein
MYGVLAIAEGSNLVAIVNGATLTSAEAPVIEVTLQPREKKQTIAPTPVPIALINLKPHP